MTGQLFQPDGAVLHFEVAWGQNPTDLDAALTWTDESSRLVSWECAQSTRATEFDMHQAGTASFTVDNSDRRFDPNNTASALYSSLAGKMWHPVRFYGYKPGGGGFPFYVWRGFIERIDQARDVNWADRYIGAVFACVDPLGWLAQAQLPDSAWQVEVLRGVRFEDDGSAVPAPPVHQWRLGESDGTVCRDSTILASPGAANGTYAGTVAPTYNYRRGLVNGSPDGCIQFDGVDMHAALASHTLTPPFTLHAVISPQTLARRNPLYALTGTGSASCVFELTAADELKVTYNDGADQRSNTSTTQTFDPAQVYNVSAVVLPNAAPVLYLDTVDVSGAGSGSGTLGAITGTAYLARAGTDYFAGLLDEFLVYDFDLSALPGYGGGSTRLDDLFDVRRDAWDQDLFHQRVKKILDAVSYPVDLRYITQYSTWEMDPAEFAGRNALAYLQEIARSEDGLLFFTTYGRLCAFDHRARWEGEVFNAGTFSDDPAATGVLRMLMVNEAGYDVAWVRNRITARRKYGSELVAQDPSTTGGASEDLGTLMLKDEANIQALLDHRLAIRKTPASVVRQLSATPRPDEWDTLLAIDLVSTVTVEQTWTRPGGSAVGSAVSGEYWVEGVRDSGSVRGDQGGPFWVRTLTLSPWTVDPD